MVQQQTTQNTQMKVVALAMQILGTKNEAELKTALSKMSEVGRTKFIQQCSNIIQTGDQSPESLKQAQQLAQMALEEGPEQDYTQMARHGASLRRYYFGGRVKTYDGNYMDLKKPLNKDQVEGREAIGVYKGKWMYLNSDKIAIPKPGSKAKSYDGTTHVNRAYYGILLPKPYRYDIGGTINKIGDFFGNVWDGVTYGIKQIPQALKKGTEAVGKGISKGMQGAQGFSKNLYDKYGMDFPGALGILASGLANTFNKPALNSIGTIGDALFTNTPPYIQSTEVKTNQGAANQGEGQTDNGAPATTTPTSIRLSQEEMNKIIDALKKAGITIDNPNTFYSAVQQSLTQ